MEDNIGQIEIKIGDKYAMVEYDKSKYPLYHDPMYGPNQEYRDAMLRRTIVAGLLQDN